MDLQILVYNMAYGIVQADEGSAVKAVPRSPFSLFGSAPTGDFKNAVISPAYDMTADESTQQQHGPRPHSLNLAGTITTRIPASIPPISSHGPHLQPSTLTLLSPLSHNLYSLTSHILDDASCTPGQSSSDVTSDDDNASHSYISADSSSCSSFTPFTMPGGRPTPIITATVLGADDDPAQLALFTTMARKLCEAPEESRSDVDMEELGAALQQAMMEGVSDVELAGLLSQVAKVALVHINHNSGSDCESLSDATSVYSCSMGTGSLISAATLARLNGSLANILSTGPPPPSRGASTASNASRKGPATRVLQHQQHGTHTTAITTSSAAISLSDLHLVCQPLPHTTPTTISSSSAGVTNPRGTSILMTDAQADDSSCGAVHDKHAASAAPILQRDESSLVKLPGRAAAPPAPVGPLTQLKAWPASWPEVHDSLADVCFPIRNEFWCGSSFVCLGASLRVKKIMMQTVKLYSMAVYVDIIKAAHHWRSLDLLPCCKDLVTGPHSVALVMHMVSHTQGKAFADVLRDAIEREARTAGEVVAFQHLYAFFASKSMLLPNNELAFVLGGGRLQVVLCEPPLPPQLQGSPARLLPLWEGATPQLDLHAPAICRSLLVSFLGSHSCAPLLKQACELNTRKLAVLLH